MLVWDRVLSFMDAQVIMTAEKIGVFEKLADGPATAAEVAQRVGISEDSALRLLTALCAQELVARTPGGEWHNSATASDWLVPGGTEYIGPMLRHVRDELYPLWNHFEEALREGRSQWHRAFPGGPAPTESVYEDPERLRAFVEGMHTISYPAGRDFAGMEPELSRISHIVDIGGAGGSFLIGIAERHPHIRGTVFDLPPVGEVADDLIRRHGLGGRLTFRPGDFWEDPLPGNGDAYCLGFILHDWDTAGGSRLLGKVADVSRPGTWLIVGEYLLDEERTGPHFVARQDLNMLVAARGRERTRGEYARWFREYGFELKRSHLAGNGKSFLVAVAS